VAQYGFGLGAVVSASGLILLAREFLNRVSFQGVLMIASVGMLAGALLWGINLIQRAKDFEGFAHGAHPN
jgi:hypothetical protein